MDFAANPGLAEAGMDLGTGWARPRIPKGKYFGFQWFLCRIFFNRPWGFLASTPCFVWVVSSPIYPKKNKKTWDIPWKSHPGAVHCLNSLCQKEFFHLEFLLIKSLGIVIFVFWFFLFPLPSSLGWELAGKKSMFSCGIGISVDSVGFRMGWFGIKNMENILSWMSFKLPTHSRILQ